MSAHGQSVSGLRVPYGHDITSGRFGRMFPGLPARKPTGLAKAEEYGLPGGKIDGGLTTPEDDNPQLHAGFTFLGQFTAHDVTFDPTTVLGTQAEAASVTDFSAPALRLSVLYGTGPVAHPFLYDTTSHNTKLAVGPGGHDLARTAAGTALIPDPRNDENMLLSQTHLAFIKFHNAVVDGLAAGRFTDVNGARLAPKPPDEPPTGQPGAVLDELLDVQNYYDGLFAAARRVVTWHFQWLIVHEFLPRIADQEIVADIERNGPRYFRPGDHAFMPVEFSVAGFRAFGHPSLRSQYRINSSFSAKLFPDDPDAPATPRTDLRGGAVDAAHALDFSYFFPLRPDREPQHTKRFDATLNTQILDLPVSAVPGASAGALARPVASLAVRNLLRSETLGLPCGQDVARKVGAVPLTDGELGDKGPAYLWYYLLKEALVRGGGARLGPVGSRIVAETLIGLIDADPHSYRSAYPRWRPTLAQPSGHFGVPDMLRVAGVPGAAGD
jgi:hypothetical protein